MDKFSNVIILLFLCALLIFGLYSMYLNLPIGTKIYKPFSGNVSYLPEIVINGSGEVVQFYPNMRYSDRIISYKIESACSEKKSNDIVMAFAAISEKTILSFYQSDDNPEIKVLCSDIAPLAEEKGHFVAGEGGPSEIINTTKFSVILSGKIALYRENKCDKPNVAIHEILHALGFDHINSLKSILYPITSCDQQIDLWVVDHINKLYSIDSLPDLAIDALDASSEGRYLNFNINILNIGLAKSSWAELNLYSDNEKIANFSLGDVEIGEKRILMVENLRLPSREDNIMFVVESSSRELTLDNNRIEVSAV